MGAILAHKRMAQDIGGKHETVEFSQSVLENIHDAMEEQLRTSYVPKEVEDAWFV